VTPEAPASRSEFGELARAALERYDVPSDARLAFVRHGENATFRVGDGERSFALRLARPGYHTLAALHSEIAWMDALRAAGLDTPEPVPGRDGEIVQQVRFRDRDQAVVAFEWVDGLPLPQTKARDPWARLGEIMARIHRHGREWTPPPSFERPAWDHEALVGELPRWGDPCPPGVWSRDDRALLLAARDAVRERLAALGTAPDRFGLIHADLGFENVLVADDGSAIVIDFDDCGPGWYLYEIASVLYPLEDDSRFAEYRDALVAGYRGEGELTDAMLAHLPTFLMCRRLATLGWTFSRPDTDHAQRQRANRLRTSPEAARRFLEWSAAGGGAAGP
jgi:Ser/Thr protein kinase RdoA (MazF antagonist)